MLARDGLHLKVEGHRYIAQLLYPAMVPWIGATIGEIPGNVSVENIAV